MNRFLATLTATFVVVLNMQITLPKQMPTHFNMPLTYNTYETVDIKDFSTDQGSSSNCWAIAANTAFRLYVKKHFNTLLYLDDQHIIDASPVPVTNTSGGHFKYASTYYLNHTGPIDNDGNMPYWLSAYENISNQPQAIKWHIQNQGSVIASIFYEPNRTGFFNEPESAYYNPSTNNPMTHNVLLVGWDDTYSRHNFRNKPKQNGAFIAQNSFGSNWGKEGLFYISYEDAQVLSEVYALTKIKPADKSQVHYYDETGVTHFDGFGAQSTVWAANTYTASKHHPTHLYAIGLYTDGPTHIEIYTGHKSAKDNENTFDSKHFIRFPGYHTIELKNPLALDINQRFHIKVIFKGQTPFLIPIEAPYPHMSYTVTSAPQEGYLGYDTYKVSNQDFRSNSSIAIRAYTK